MFTPDPHNCTTNPKPNDGIGNAHLGKWSRGKWMVDMSEEWNEYCNIKRFIYCFCHFSHQAVDRCVEIALVYESGGPWFDSE